MTKNKIKLSIIALAVLTSSLSAGWMINGKKVMNEYPLQKGIRSIEHGGTLSAIEAYSDGIGVIVEGNNLNEDNKIDNSAFNNTVFKYGTEAKLNNLTIGEQVSLGFNNQAPTIKEIKLAIIL